MARHQLFAVMRDLAHCGLVTPCGDRDLGQHWLRKWLVVWRHQAITWTNVDWSSVESSDIHIRAISQEMPRPSITKIHLKITHLKFNSNFPGASDLTYLFHRSVQRIQGHIRSWSHSPDLDTWHRLDKGLVSSHQYLGISWGYKTHLYLYDNIMREEIMSLWWPLSGLWNRYHSNKSSHRNTVEDFVLVDSIWIDGYETFNWCAPCWLLC